LPEKPVEPSLQDSLPPAPAFKTMKEYDEHEERRRNRTRKAKKAKKDSVHPVPEPGVIMTNVQVFPEVSSNRVSESGELLFIEENLKVFPNSPSIINPKHPHAPYFRALIESLNLDNDEGYLNDPLLDMTRYTDKLSQVEYEEPLDWGTQALKMISPLMRTRSATSFLLRLVSAVSHLPWLPLTGRAKGNRER
jgi:hypothetical protein